MRNIEDRLLDQTAMELAKRSDLEHFILIGRANIHDPWFAFIALAPIVAAFAFGGAVSWLVVSNDPESTKNLIIAWTIFGSAGCGLTVGIIIFQWLVNASKPLYEAQMKEVDEDLEGEDWIRGPEQGNHFIRIPRQLREDLRTLVQHYGTEAGQIPTLAIAQWAGRSKPLTRQRIETIRDFLVKREFGFVDEGGEVHFTERGRRELERWRAGDWGGLTSPTPNPQTSPA